jgi:acyl-CoA synthetase (AMP-forming)/AMP-acid ligase II
MLLTRLLERAARHAADLPAISCGTTTHTWRESESRCGRVASALCGLGVKPGDRVAYLSLNSIDYFEAFFSIAWMGGVIVPLNTRHALPEHVAIAADCTPVALVVDEAFVEMGREIVHEAETIEHLIVTGVAAPGEGAEALDTLVAKAEPMPPIEASPDDVASLFYTSGTTGDPKGVMLTHRNFYVNAMGSLMMYNTGNIMRGLLPGPLFHVATTYRVFAATMACTHTVLLPRFEPAALFRIIDEYQIESMSLVPTMIGMMLDHPEVDAFDLSSLRILGYGASPITETVLRRAMEKYPHVEFRQGYGMTEGAPLATVLGWAEHQAVDEAPHLLRSAGKPMAHVELKIVDPDDRDLPGGEIGEIAIRGPNVMKGYWNKPKETAFALRGGWYHTGDAGYLDEDGYLFIVDRVKDMIVTGGENVYSSEVENVLDKHPAVAQCAVIGVPHEKWVEAVHAVVVLRHGACADEAQLIEFCRQQIANYKCPRSVGFRTDPLPLSGSNKVLKTDLRAQYVAEMAEQAG